MAVLSGGIDGAVDFRYRGLIATHRVYGNRHHWFSLSVTLLLRLSIYSAAVSITSRPLYCPQWGQTRCGSLGSWQLGHSAKAGFCRASWARRFWVRALECRRFGFGMVVLLLFPYRMFL